MNKYAIFAAATDNYLMYINAQLNSIEKRELYNECDLTYYLMHHDNFNRGYLQDIQDGFSFPVIPIEIDRGDMKMPDETKRIEYVKRCRYKKMVPLAINYDVTCFMDADMFIVSDKFINLFDMVKDTDCLIGCNEKYKWNIGDNYFYAGTGKKLLSTPSRLFNFICNTPAIFNMKSWMEVFEAYEDIAIRGRQYKNGDKENVTGIGDIHTWNIAIQQQNRNGDVVCFPMETMAQVHYTNMKEWTLPVVDGGYWRTTAGDRVYIMHGRMATWTPEGHLKKFRQMETGMKEDHLIEKNYKMLYEIKPDLEKTEEHIVKGLRAIQKELYDLNYNYSIKLENYIEVPHQWKGFK